MGHTAEVVTTLKGTTFRVAESTPDMYASIDLVANRLVSVSSSAVFIMSVIISVYSINNTFSTPLRSPNIYAKI